MGKQNGEREGVGELLCHLMEDFDIFIHFQHCGSINNRVTIAPFSLLITSTDK